MSGLDQDVAAIREALVNYGTWRMQKPKREKALAALDRLTARLQVQRDATQRHYEVSCEAIRRSEAAEARHADLYEKYQEHAREWDAREAALREALQNLMDYGQYDTTDPSPQATAARSALEMGA